MNHFKKYLLMNIWQKSKGITVSCLDIIKCYNNGMDGVDIRDQKTAAYRLLIVKASIALTSVCFWSHGCHTCKQTHCFHETWWWLNFKIVVGKALIGRYSNRNRSFSTTRPSKRKPVRHLACTYVWRKTEIISS